MLGLPRVPFSVGLFGVFYFCFVCFLFACPCTLGFVCLCCSSFLVSVVLFVCSFLLTVFTSIPVFFRLFSSSSSSCSRFSAFHFAFFSAFFVSSASLLYLSPLLVRTCMVFPVLFVYVVGECYFIPLPSLFS